MGRGFVAWVAVAALFGVGPGCAAWKQTEATESSGPGAAKLCGFDGVESAIADAKGKVVLIDCWATWCGPCVSSFPQLVEKHKKYAEKGLAVISLSLDKPSDADKVADFLVRQNATFTNLHLKRDAVSQKGLDGRLGYGGGIPHAALFNRKGERVWTGHPMDPELEPLIVAELAK